MSEGTGPQWCDFRKDSIRISGNLRHNILIAQGDHSPLKPCICNPQIPDISVQRWCILIAF